MGYNYNRLPNQIRYTSLQDSPLANLIDLDELNLKVQQKIPDQLPQGYTVSRIEASLPYLRITYRYKTTLIIVTIVYDLMKNEIEVINS